MSCLLPIKSCGEGVFFKIGVPLERFLIYKGFDFHSFNHKMAALFHFLNSKVQEEKLELKGCQPIHLYPVCGSGILFFFFLLPPLIMTLKGFCSQRSKEPKF